MATALSALLMLTSAVAVDPVQEQAVASIERQPVGLGTIGDLDLPPPFLEQLADHAIRDAHHRRHHLVFDDLGRPRPEARPIDRPPVVPVDWIALHRTRLPDEVRRWRETLQPGWPQLRGFRFPLLDRAGATWPIALPHDANTLKAHAAKIVAERLARDGLLPTLARVLEILGPRRFVAPDETTMRELRETGLPVDLVRFFRLEDGTAVTAGSLASDLAGGRTARSLHPELSEVAFAFQPARPGFAAAAENGQDAPALIRSQLPRGTYWRGPGGGGSVDLLRQVVEALPGTDVLVSLESRDLGALVATATTWPLEHAGQLTVVAEPFFVSQWAQDNGKAGSLPSPDGTARQPATIVPRFASRRNDSSEFITGDSFLADGLAAAGHAVFQSPLLFQGGNMLICEDPRSSRRTLLVSEAEVHRNRALGLTWDQVLEAMRVEFGVDECAVVPLVSFHLDFDVTVRAVGAGLVAFVNDTEAAARLVVECALPALKRAGLALEDGRGGDPVELAGLLHARTDARGAYPLSLAEHLAAGEMDSGVGNLQRLLTALEILQALALDDGTLPRDPLARSTLLSWRRTVQAQAELIDRLEARGWRVVRVPSLAAAEQSLNTINGIHTPDAYLMPAYGGLFKPLDDAAADVFSRALGPEVDIIPVLCAESQRRAGGVHCSLAAY